MLRIDPSGGQSVLTDRLLVSGAPRALAPGDALLCVVNKTPEYQLRKWYNIVHPASWPGPSFSRGAERGNEGI